MLVCCAIHNFIAMSSTDDLSLLDSEVENERWDWVGMHDV